MHRDGFYSEGSLFELCRLEKSVFFVYNALFYIGIKHLCVAIHNYY
jgi:hypothetical protein